MARKNTGTRIAWDCRHRRRFNVSSPRGAPALRSRRAFPLEVDHSGAIVGAVWPEVPEKGRSGNNRVFTDDGGPGST